MEPAHRIPIIKRCASTLSGQGWAEIDFLLRQFHLPTTDEWGGSGPSSEYGYVLAMLGAAGEDDDPNLIALHDFLHDAPAHDVDQEPWSGICRIFISHVWSEREDAMALQLGLTSWGLDSFVAHRDIQPAAEWQQVILAALHSCTALVALLHDGYGKSDWCDQEAGVAIGRKVPVIPVRVDINPYGLLGAYQALPWPADADNPGRRLALQIVDLLLRNKRTTDRVIAALVERLATARSFDEAGDVAAKLVRTDVPLTADQVERVRVAMTTNGQLSGSRRAEGALATLIPEPPPPPPSVQIARSTYGPDEAPF